MTENQRFLLTAAKELAAYVSRRYKGMPSQGMYEDVERWRFLTAAIEAVEAEQAKESDGIASALEYAAQTHVEF